MIGNGIQKSTKSKKSGYCIDFRHCMYIILFVSLLELENNFKILISQNSFQVSTIFQKKSELLFWNSFTNTKLNSRKI